MRIDRPRHGDKPGEGDKPDREPDRPPDPQQDQVERIRKANADQRRNADRLSGRVEALGYDVHDPEARRKASDQVADRLQSRLPDLDVVDRGVGKRITKYEVRDDITGPNGKSATLRTFWRLGAGGTTPRLITNWAEIHTDRDQGGNQ